MATLPTSGTDIRFLTGVPFSLDYKDTRWFDTKAEQEDYFFSREIVHQLSTANFQKAENTRYISVSKRVEQLYDVNYVMFRNSDYGTKWFYAFVTHLEYKNGNCTYVHIELDVLQTWRFRLEFKPSYIVREHCKLWNDDGSPVINTIDEGLNYGIDYDIVKVQKFQPFEQIKFLVIVCKTPMHEGDDGNDVSPVLIGMPQPLTFYVTPFRSDDKTPTIMQDGKAIVNTPPTRLLKELYANEKAVNNIVSIYITDDIGIAGTVDMSIPASPAMTFSDFETSLKEVTVAGSVSTLLVKKINKFDMRSTIVDANKYSGYKSVKESKLLMYPYTTLVIDDFKGNRSAYKNEYIRSKEIEILVKGSIGLSNYVSYGVAQYNHASFMDVDYASDLINANNDSAVVNNTPNDVTVINDYLTAFLQGNKNQISNQEDTAIFNGVMNGITSVASGFAGMQTPSPMAPIAGFSEALTGAGNTVLELQGIQAKQKDIANIPPSIQKMGTNTAYSMGHSYDGVFLVKKQIKSEYIRKLTDFFNAYGYKVNEVKLPNLHTRRYWNYIQTKDISLKADMNYADLQRIRKIFDNGITLWHTNDIGNYDLENEVI